MEFKDGNSVGTNKDGSMFTWYKIVCGTGPVTDSVSIEGEGVGPAPGSAKGEGKGSESAGSVKGP